MELSKEFFERLLVGEEEFRAMEWNGSTIPAGRLFELFMCGYMTDGKKPVWLPFSAAMRKAILFARKNGHDAVGLSHNTCYARRLFAEVKNVLPRGLRSALRMYSVIGTSLDQYHGIDIVFLLSGAYVGVDCTLDPFESFDASEKLQLGKKENHSRDRAYQQSREKKPNILQFTFYDLSQRRTNIFAREVVKKLLSREGNLPRKVNSYI